MNDKPIAKLLLREPTQAMLDAANREWDGRMSARSAGVWQAMWDAAAPATEPPAGTLTPETDVESYDAIANTNSALLADDVQEVVSAKFARSLERRLRQCDIERAKWKEWNEASQYDCMAYRGALGEPIPESHDGRLSDGTTPMNYLVNWIARERDAALREVEELREALREEPGKWGWDFMLFVGRRVLDELYPADIFTGASGDLGPVYIVALRNALAAIDTAALAEKGKP